MSSIDARIVALMLNIGEPCTRMRIVNGCNESFGPRESDQLIKEHVRLLVGRNVLNEFDPETEGVFADTLFDHDQHGSIDGTELSPMLTDAYFTLGPHMVPFVQENHADLMSACREAGFDKAGLVLEEMRPDLGFGGTRPPKIHFRAGEREKVLNLLGKALRELDSLDLPNSKSAQAKAYVEAAIILTESPEPDVRIVWELIQRANQVAGIASLFVAVLAIMMAN